MSHFTCLVIGDNIEEVLAPFHEFECTGLNDQYVQNIDITEEVRARMAGTGEYQKDGAKETLEEALDWYGLDEKIVESEDEISIEDDHKYGYAIVKDGVLIKAVNRTNPNRHWDWWQLGGRWTGFLRLKPTLTLEEREEFCTVGTPGLLTPPCTDAMYVDSARIKDIDFCGMRDEAEMKARERHQKVVEFFGGIPHMEFKWSELVEREGMAIEEKRVLYASQEAKRKTDWDNIKDLPNDLRELLQWADIEAYCCTEDEYAQRFRDSAISTFALVKDGEWFERGKMGWWACVSDDKGEKWNEEFAKILDQLDPDTLISVVDCHI